MNVQEVLSQVRDTLAVKRVFGDPYEKNGLTLIPVATISGGGGAGEGQDDAGHPSGGGGFGVGGRAMGAYVVKGDTVRWLPAVDVNRVIMGAQIVAIVALISVRSMAKERAKVAMARAGQTPGGSDGRMLLWRSLGTVLRMRPQRFLADRFRR